jgi:hypothetical protein
MASIAAHRWQPGPCLVIRPLRALVAQEQRLRRGAEMSDIPNLDNEDRRENRADPGNDPDG